jgi:hypothetical protein
MQSMSVKHLCTSRHQAEKPSHADAVEGITKRYHENPQLYRRRQEINEHILAPLNANGVQSYQFNGTEKVNGEHSRCCITSNAVSSWAFLI